MQMPQTIDCALFKVVPGPSSYFVRSRYLFKIAIWMKWKYNQIRYSKDIDLPILHDCSQAISLTYVLKIRILYAQPSQANANN